MIKVKSEAGNHRPTIVSIVNYLPYFFAHKSALYSGLEFEYRLKLIGGGSINAEQTSKFEIDAVYFDKDAYLSLSDFAFFCKIVSVLWREKPKSIVSYTLKANILTAFAVAILRWRLRGAKLTLVVSGLGRVFSANKSTKAMWLKKVALWLLFLSCRASNANALFENHEDKKLWVRHGIINPRQGRVLLGTGISIDRAEVEDKPVNEKLQVAFAGRLLKAKGIEIFVDIARALTKNDQIEFDVYGDTVKSDPAYFNPSNPASELPKNIKFHGWIEPNTLSEAFRRSDVVCLPTQYMEGLPRVLLEGALAGCAVISTNQPGCSRIVKEGVTGRLVKETSPEAIKTAIVVALEAYSQDRELCSAHGKNAEQRIISERFAVEYVSKSFKQFILPSSDSKSEDEVGCIKIAKRYTCKKN